MTDQPQIHRQLLTDQNEKPVYANNVLVSHTATEFTIDFVVEFSPNAQQPDGSIVMCFQRQASVKLPPALVSQFLAALSTNLASYEATFGKIPATMIPDTFPLGPDDGSPLTGE